MSPAGRAILGESMKKEYWTVFNFGLETICSKHKTFAAAEKAAIKCENAGGAEHKIIEAKVIPRRSYGKGIRKAVQKVNSTRN